MRHRERCATRRFFLHATIPDEHYGAYAQAPPLPHAAHPRRLFASDYSILLLRHLMIIISAITPYSLEHAFRFFRQRCIRQH